MLTAADEVFTAHGYRAASMDQIAVAAGITKPMLYAYFESKEHLFIACRRLHGRRLRKRILDAAEEKDVRPDRRLWQGLLAFFEYVDENRGSWTVFRPPGAGTAPGALGEGTIAAENEAGDLLGRFFIDAAREAAIGEQAAEQAEPMGRILVGAAVGAVDWWLLHPEQPKELHVLRLMNMVWNGFEGLLEGKLWLPEGSGSND